MEAAGAVCAGGNRAIYTRHVIRLNRGCQGKVYLLSGLVGGGHHHRVADGKSDEEINDVRQVRGQLGHGLAVVSHEIHLTAAFIEFVQELWVRGDVFLLQDKGGMNGGVIRACWHYEGGAY